MRKLAPALFGRVTRSAIVHSPHTWNATASTFLIFAVSDAIVSQTIPVVDVTRLYVLSTLVGVVGITIFLTRPPERGSLFAHLLVTAVYGGVSLAIFAHAPDGSGPMITGMFIPVLTALWIEERRHAIAHMVLASCLLLAAALTGGNDPQTVAAVLCFIPACGLLYVATTTVLDALDAQGAALDDLGRRDPLTGVGNRRMLDEELGAELTRHRSGGRPLAVIDLAIAEFDALSQRVGRAAGDAVLLFVAEVIGREAPGSATVTCIDGTNFVVVLPNASGDDALQFTQRVREQVPTSVGRERLALQAGIARYPSDGTGRAALCETAATRRAADTTPAGTRGGDGTVTAMPWTVVTGGFEAVPPPKLPPRVSRADLAVDRLIWTALGGGLLLYCSVAGVADVLIDDFAGPAFPFVFGFGMLAAAVFLVTRPPAIGARRNHVAIAITYLLPIAAMVVATPHASWAVGTALLAPLLIAVRITDRRLIAAHLLLATIGLPVAALLAGVDPATWVAVAALAVNSWVLGVCVVVVFEAAEQQSKEIAGLILRDPLTGAGNRALLRERLSGELGPHDAMQMSLVLVALDLPELPVVAREHGRGVANALLREVALTAGRVVGSRATVSRLAGGLFGVLLPFTDLTEPARAGGPTLIESLEVAIAEVSVDGVSLTPRVGVAQYPEDARSVEQLEQLAEARCRTGEPAPAAPVDRHEGRLRRAAARR